MGTERLLLRPEEPGITFGFLRAVHGNGFATEALETIL